MWHFVRCTLLPVLLVLAMGAGLAVTAAPANATTGGCYGASCNGQDPSGRCDDGITVAAMAVTDGMLELRYSPSCKQEYTFMKSEMKILMLMAAYVAVLGTYFAVGDLPYHESSSGAIDGYAFSNTLEFCLGLPSDRTSYTTMEGKSSN